MPACAILAQALLLARLTNPYPFAVGETLQYDATLGVFPIGTATATVTGMTRERGKEAFVFNASGEGGPPGVRATYEMTSWVGTGTFNSLRFNRRWVQPPRGVQEEHYQIIPDSSRYRIEGKPQDWVAPRDPLDELAFLYYLRTIPMKVGGNYQISRYFKNAYNPVTVSVVSRDTAQLPSGKTVPVLVVQVAAQGTTVGVWFTDDARRIPVRLDLPLPWGSVTLELTGGA
jgi:hypothetical protein